MSATHRLLRFGLFELNLDTEELRKDGIPLKLGPQPFRVLAILAGRSGQIVTRDEIRQRVWGDETYVDFEHGLNQCIKQIRTALNDNSSKPLYIETLPRKGYRFLAPVTSKTVAVVAKVTASSSGVQPRVVLPMAINRSPEGLPAVASSAAAQSPAIDHTMPPASPPEVFPNKQAATAEKAAPQPSARGRLGRYVRWLALPLLAVIGIAFYWHSQQANALMETETVVLGDFANSTGEPVFDDALRQALRIQLEQTPYLNLVSDQKVNATLRLMGRSAGEHLTDETARDVCQRIGSKAMFTGSITQLGSRYVVGVQATNCTTGDVLAEAQEQAKSKEAVLDAMGRAALGVRRKLGESLRSIQNYATAVEEATTPSLEALQAYSQGRKVVGLEGDTSAIPYYKRAIEIDPNFAMAHLNLASAYTNLNQGARAAENAAKAYELRQKVTERERFVIDAFYYMRVTGELEKTAATYELAQRTYPRDPVIYQNLAVTFPTLGNYEKGLAEAREALRLDPARGPNYANLGQILVDVNKFDEAAEVYKEAERRKLDGEWIVGDRYNLAFANGDFNQMAKLVADAEGKPGTEDVLLAMQSDTEAWHGKLRRARELTLNAMESANHNDAKETAAGYQVAAALREAESGDRRRALDDANSALKLAQNRDIEAVAALTFARAGDTASAERLASELDSSFPLDTLVQKYWLPAIRAAIALAHNQPEQAIELLKTTGSLELASPANVSVVLVPAYLRGQAYLMLRQGPEARAEFQKFLDYRGLVSNFQWGALARLSLARAYAIEAETDPAVREKTLAAYQDFLALWKDADPDVPIYRQVRVEYAKLTGAS